MTFQSVSFPIFLCLLILLIAVTKKETVRQCEILGASVFFYGSLDFKFLILIVCFMLMVHVAAAVIMKNSIPGKECSNWKKAALVVCIVLLMMILGIFKYFGFFVPGIILPVGISFYTFSAIGYVVDVYRGEITKKRPFYQEALYILFFPKLLQGPLHKAADFFEQLSQEHPITWDNLSAGIQIFLFGLAKKVVIADRLGLFVDTVYARPVIYSGATLLLAALTYPVQLYCDFSGYSDMAVGTAKMLGYDLCQNFNLPFLSKNVAEYWRRWHMSLNIWFRDYLFYPVIRSRRVIEIRKKAKMKSKRLAKLLPQVIGMAVVWPLVGLWHGASLNYTAYGCIYGFLMIAGQIAAEYKRKDAWNKKGYDILCILRTIVLTVLLLVLFRMPDLGGVCTVLFRIFTWKRGVQYFYTWSLLFIPLVMGISVYAYRKNGGNGYYINMDLSKFWSKVILCTAVLMIIIFMYVGENYFMYFKF